MVVLIGLSLITFCLFCLVLFAERIAIYLQGGTESIPKGLQRSLEAVLEKNPKNTPRLVVFSDPLPYAVVIKAVARRGTVLLSQGLLVSSNDAELKSILKSCLSKLNRRGISLESLLYI